MNTAVQPTLFDTETVSSLVAYARTRPHGIGHYLQLRPCPLTSVEVKVNEENEVSMMRFIGMNDSVDYPKDKYKTIPIGYDWYQENIVSNLNIVKDKSFTMREWRSAFLSFVTKIDDAIRQHHGIVCYRSGVDTNQGISNYMVLHFVDVMNIYVRKKWKINEECNIKITSDTFNSIPENIVDTFTPTLTKKETKFLDENLDILCYLYGYWHNYSNKPIRTQLVNHPSVHRMFHLSEWDKFEYHQQVKWNTLCRCVHDPIVSFLYLTT